MTEWCTKILPSLPIAIFKIVKAIQSWQRNICVFTITKIWKVREYIFFELANVCRALFQLHIRVETRLVSSYSLSSWSYVHDNFFLNLNLFVRCVFGVVATNLLRPSSSSSPSSPPLAKDDVKLSLYCNLIHLQALLLNDVSCNWNFSHFFLCFIKITRRWNFP